jgi:patatin-like phospholipase/acyl hydrolase
MCAYKILALDGGGIRGLITAMLLERLEHACPGFLDQIDLFAGTSTGGLLALGLAAGKTPHDARKLYELHGEHVFADTVLDDIRDIGTLLGADYSLQPLRDALKEEFPGLKLGHLPKKVLVSAFDLDNQAQSPGARHWKPKFFHNYPGPDSDGDQWVVDVGLYTAAAPTYFPIVDGFIDGGVVAGNPSMCALAQALHPATGGQVLEDIVLLSMGTGSNPRYLESQTGDWGLVQWAPHILNMMFEGSAGLADYQCQQLLGERYLRVNPILPYPIAMDRIDQIPAMRRLAVQVPLAEAADWITKHFQL